MNAINYDQIFDGLRKKMNNIVNDVMEAAEYLRDNIDDKEEVRDELSKRMKELKTNDPIFNYNIIHSLRKVYKDLLIPELVIVPETKAISLLKEYGTNEQQIELYRNDVHVPIVKRINKITKTFNRMITELSDEEASLVFDVSSNILKIREPEDQLILLNINKSKKSKNQNEIQQVFLYLGNGKFNIHGIWTIEQIQKKLAKCQVIVGELKPEFEEELT